MPCLPVSAAEQAGQLSQIRDLIGRAESDSAGGYNAVVGQKSGNPNLTKMTVAEVQKYQRDLIRQGKGSAVGRYQVIATTFRDLIGKMGIKDDELFDAQLQDRIADFLIQQKGYAQYLRNPTPEGKERFLSALSMTWAGLPSGPSGKSYYEGKGNNKATVGWQEALQSFQRGGIANMPDSGGLAKLHGTEAVVPLPDGRTIPVMIKNDLTSVGGSSADMDGVLSRISQEISTAVQNAANSLASNLQLQPILTALEELARYQRENVDVNERMLRNTMS